MDTSIPRRLLLLLPVVGALSSKSIVADASLSVTIPASRRDEVPISILFLFRFDDRLNSVQREKAWQCVSLLIDVWINADAKMNSFGTEFRNFLFLVLG